MVTHFKRTLLTGAIAGVLVAVPAFIASAQDNNLLCLSDVCINENLKHIKVHWLDKTNERAQGEERKNNFLKSLSGVYGGGTYAEALSDDSVLKEIARNFPTADSGTEAQILKYGINLLNDTDGDLLGSIYLLDSLSYPAFTRIDAICHPVELKGEFQSDDGHKTIVFLLPKMDGNRDYWSVFRIVRLYPNIRHESPEAEALLKQFKEKFTGATGGWANLIPTDFVDSNGERNEGFNLQLSKTKETVINSWTVDELEKALAPLNQQPFCHPAGNTNIE